MPAIALGAQHQDNHHAAYVKNLNGVLKDHPELHARPPHELIAHLADALRTSGRWRATTRAGAPITRCSNRLWGSEGELATAVARYFGSFAQMQEDLNKTATRSSAPAGRWCLSILRASLPSFPVGTRTRH